MFVTLCITCIMAGNTVTHEFTNSYIDADNLSIGLFNFHCIVKQKLDIFSLKLRGHQL